MRGYVRHDLMKSRNPRVGTHFGGSPLAKMRGLTQSRTGSASGQFVGTGVNRKSAASPEYDPSRSMDSRNYTRQIEEFNRQAPEPFRNPQLSANPQRGAAPIRLNQPYVTPAPNLRPGDWKRAQPQREPHSQEEINLASGHPADYEPAGQSGVVGVRRRQPRAGDINLPGGPKAKRLGQRFKTNNDNGSPFNAASMAAWARREGGRGGQL